GISLGRSGQVVTLNGSMTVPNYVDFTSTSSPTYSEGRLFYDSVEKSLAYYNSIAGQTLNIGQENWIQVMNSTGSTIPDGSAVYINGADVSGIPTIALAQANTLITSQVVGITTNNILDGDIGYVVSSGSIHDLNTSSFSAGDILYLSSTTPGNFTTTKPSVPSYGEIIGYVTKSDSTAGIILVKLTDAKVGKYTTGSIGFGDSIGLISEDNTNLFWNNSTKRLGIGDNTPSATLTVGNGTPGSSKFSVIGSTGNITTSGNLAVNGGTINTSGALTINSSGTNALTLDSTSTGTVNIGTGASGKIINIGTNNTIADTINIGSALDTLNFIGNSNSTLVLSGSTLSATELNRLDGKDATLVDTNDAITLAITGTGALDTGSITSGFGSIDTGADNITTTGTVFANNFDRSTSGSLTFGNTNATSVSICNSANCDTITLGTNADADTITIGDTLDTLSFASTGLNVSTSGALTGVLSIDTIGISSTALTFAGAGTINSTTSSALTLDSTTTGAINIGNSANAKTITIGNTTSTTAVNINSGTGSIRFTTGPTSSSSSVRIGNSATATPDLLVLDNGSADPAGTNGGMYYSTALNKFRCYENGAWANCISTGGSGSGSNVQLVKADLNETLITGTSSATATSIGTISITPSTATGDVYVYANLWSKSGSNADQTISLEVRTGSSCNAGSLLNTGTAQLVSSNGTNGPNLYTAALITNPGASAQAYVFYGYSSAGSASSIGGPAVAMVIDTGADLAEMYYSEELLSPGTVVSIDPNLLIGITKSENAYDKNLLGVITTKPGLVLGDDTTPTGSPALVALSGRIPVNVSVENGAINSGDFLTSSSIPGVAMKATDDGMVIGQALTSYDGEEIGQVIVFIKNTYSPGDFTIKEQKQLLGDISTIEGLTTLVLDIQTEVARNPITIINEKITAGKKLLTDFVVARITAIRGYFDEIFTNTSHQKTLCVGESGDETCITKAQLDALLNSQSISPINNSSNNIEINNDIEIISDINIDTEIEDIETPVPDVIEGEISVEEISSDENSAIDTELVLETVTEVIIETDVETTPEVIVETDNETEISTEEVIEEITTIEEVVVEEIEQEQVEESVQVVE
ncbi:MAG: hypothetical protein WCX46_02330, partial [Candidatus Paceibacterota bacterium]